MADQLKLDLDPKKVVDSLRQIADETKRTTKQIEDSMQKSSEGVERFEETAKNGASRIQSFFRNLGHTVREDLKEAFNVTGILSGLKMADEIKKGVTSIFDMEQAFARLNTRLGLTTSKLSEFKSLVGRQAASAGQNAQDVLPGVEIAAARGGVHSAAQLGDIAGSLAQARAATGEDTSGIAEHVVSILKGQKMAVTSQSFKSVLDALQGARANGAFHGIGDAGSAVDSLAQITGTKLSIREMAGLSAQASRGGDGSTHILEQIMAQSKTLAGQQYMNSMFGVNLFQGGKLNAESIGKINLKRFGTSQEQFGQIAGFEGSSGSDLVRFVQSFRGGLGTMKQVVSGSNETATQFQTASDNLKSQLDRFKQHVIEGAREIGDGLSEALHGATQGSRTGVMSGLKHAASGAWENKGSLLAALGLTTGVSVLAGQGIRGLLGKSGGLAGGVATGEALRAASNVQPVYVVNAGEMGGGSGAGGIMTRLGGLIGEGALARMASLGTVGLVGGTAVASVWAGNELGKTEAGKSVFNDTFGKVFDGLDLGGVQKAQMELMKTQNDAADRIAEREHISKAMAMAVVQGLQGANLTVKGPAMPLTNPSDVRGRGGPR